MKPPEPTRLVVFDIITSSSSKTGSLKAKVHAEELRGNRLSEDKRGRRRSGRSGLKKGGVVLELKSEKIHILTKGRSEFHILSPVSPLASILSFLTMEIHAEQNILR